MGEGIIVLGHGSRRPRANQEIAEITELVKARYGEAQYLTCFLQFGEPDLPEGIKRLTDSGVTKITVVPLLLAMGSHIAVELPEILAEQKRQYPGVKFILAPHLGAEPRIADIVIDRLKQGSEL